MNSNNFNKSEHGRHQKKVPSTKVKTEGVAFAGKTKSRPGGMKMRNGFVTRPARHTQCQKQQKYPTAAATNNENKRFVIINNNKKKNTRKKHIERTINNTIGLN